MKAEIISIGSELTSGQNLDTNSQWLSQRLAEIGIPVGWHTTIADDFDANVEAFRIAIKRAGLVIATGGLGPTQDDLTREVLAHVGGVELVLHPESLARIEQMFQRFKRAMPERNRVQAMFPAGAEPIANNRGTAPGIWMKFPESIVVAMPGVPSEMFVMYRDTIQPRLVALGVSRGVQVERKINCFGAGESGVEAKLLDLTRRGQTPEVGITVSDAVISLRILGRGVDERAAREQIAPVEALIRERLGRLVFGVDGEDLEDAVAHLMERSHLTLATAESVTGGLVARKLTRPAGASSWFVGGLVAYQTRVKLEHLAVPQSLIEEHGIISAPVVEAMARGCRLKFGSDLAVSTVGLAGPTGSEDKPVGLVYAGLAWDGGERSQTLSWAGTRDEVQSRASRLALNLVRLHLLERLEA